MSREIEVFGAAKVSENYLDKFFKKAGTVVKITPKKDRVIIVNHSTYEEVQS